MQKIATRVFMAASLVFGVTGIILVLATGPEGDNAHTNQILLKILQISVFVILPSFALSVASKFLSSKS